MNILSGMKILCMVFWGHHKIGLYLRDISIKIKKPYLTSLIM